MTHPTSRWFACALLLLAATVAQADSQLEDLDHFPRAAVVINSKAAKHEFNVWVADTPARQAQGLMFVRSLDAGGGMLFVLDDPRVMTMWMKNTFIPLDMVFIEVDGRIARIAARTTPHSLETVSSGKTVKGVLEIAGGEAERLGIKAGDRLIHSAFAVLPKRNEK